MFCHAVISHGAVSGSYSSCLSDALDAQQGGIQDLIAISDPRALLLQQRPNSAAQRNVAQCREAKVSTEKGFEEAFNTLTRQPVGALSVTADPLFTSRVKQLVALAARHELPTIYKLA